MGDLGLGSLASAASGAASGAARAASNAAGEAAGAGGGLLKLLLPLLIIAAVAYGAWRMFGSNVEDLTKAGTTAVQDGLQSATDTAQNAVQDVAGSFDLDSMDFSALGEAGKTLKGGFSDITKGLSGLAAEGADEVGAQGLVDKLSDFTGKIDGLKLESLEGAAKAGLGPIVSGFLGSIEGLLGKIPEPLRSLVRPAINSLIEKLSPFK